MVSVRTVHLCPPQPNCERIVKNENKFIAIRAKLNRPRVIDRGRRPSIASDDIRSASSVDRDIGLVAAGDLELPIEAEVKVESQWSKLGFAPVACPVAYKPALWR